MPREWFAPALEPVIWVVASTLAMYVTIVVFARWSGVRSFAQLSVFDVAITIAIGSLFATTVASKDPPLLQGLSAVATLYLLQLAVSRLRARFRGMAFATDNAPILLMGPSGVIKHANLRVARVTEADLRSHLRKANVADPSHVQAVIMEGTGEINVLHDHRRPLPPDSWVLEGVRDYTTPRDHAAPEGRETR